MSTATLFVILLIWCCLSGCYFAYAFAALVLWSMKFLRISGAFPFLKMWMTIVWRLTKWPCLVFLFSDVLFAWVTGAHYTPVNAFADAGGLLFWWNTRNEGDDDDWKKLKDHIKGRVAVLNGKLVVVPARPEAA